MHSSFDLPHASQTPYFAANLSDARVGDAEFLCDEPTGLGACEFVKLIPSNGFWGGHSKRYCTYRMLLL